MISMRRVVPNFFLAGWFAILASTNAAGVEWPDGYVVYESTKSPDGRFGILVPSMATWEKNESEEATNYLADLKNHRVIGKIRDADYFEHQNHRGLSVRWADDSSLCVAEYDARFGFDSICILEPKDSSFVQTDIGKEIEKALAAVMIKQSHDKESGGGDATPYFRLAPDHTLRVRVPSTSDPKQLDPKTAHYALFRGTFDLRSKKWLSADARPLDSAQYESAESAFTELDSDLEGISFSTEDDKAKWLDDRMNEVYVVVRLILPPARFATVKKEQIEWLKKRDAAASVEEKCRSMVERIKALQELLW